MHGLRDEDGRTRYSRRRGFNQTWVLQRKLSGYSPNDMLTAVAHGIKFWNDQLELRYRTELENRTRVPREMQKCTNANFRYVLLQTL